MFDSAFSKTNRILCLVLGLASVPALRATDKVRDTDYQAPHTLVLRVTDRYKALLEVANKQTYNKTFKGTPADRRQVRRLYKFRDVLLEPRPVDPFEFLVFGRLEAQQSISDPDVCIDTLKNLAVRIAMKVALAGANPGGEPPDLDAMAIKVENAPWLRDLQDQRRTNPNFRVRYVNLVDYLHPNAISRLQCILKQVPLAEAAPGGSASAASSSSSSSAPSYGYALEGLAGANPILVDGVPLPPDHAAPVIPGTRISWRNPSRDANRYLVRIAAAKEGQPNFTGLAGLEMKDLCMEWEFQRVSPGECQVARARINSQVNPGRAWELVDQANPPASVDLLRQILSRESAQAATAVEAVRNQRIPAKAEAAAAAEAPTVEAAAAAPPRSAPEARPKPTFDPAQSELQAWRRLAGAGAAAASAAASASPSNEFSIVPFADLERVLACSICGDVVYDAVTLDCGHAFCRKCITGWFRVSPARQCPNCRKEHHGLPIPAPALNQIAKAWAARLPEARWPEREVQFAQCRGALEGPPAGQPFPGALAPGQAIHQYTVDFAKTRTTVCLFGQCRLMIGVGEARVADQQVAPLPPGRPRHYHLHCWAQMHVADQPRPVLRGREHLTLPQQRVVNGLYPE